MKLSEALVLRADVQKRVEQLRERLRASALVQEGEKPPEDPQTLFGELDGLLDQLRDLVGRINRTNLSTQLADGTTLTSALAQRDVLKLRGSVLKTVVDTASNTVSRYSRTEIRSVPTVEVGTLRRQLDDIARQYRELDTAIQATNWVTELLE
jgi:uncharacterized protein DUF6847